MIAVQPKITNLTAYAAYRTLRQAQGAGAPTRAILIYTEGDADHGMGHVVRQLVLARALIERGLEVMFISIAGTPGYVRILEAGYACLHAQPGYVAQALMAVNKGNYYDALIVDVESRAEYGIDPQVLHAARPHFRKLIVLSGAGWKRADSLAAQMADLQICQSILEDAPGERGVVSGVDHLIINPAFVQLNPTYNPAGHILVCMGGGDPHNLTEIAVEALAPIVGERGLTVITGPARTPLTGNFFSVHAPPSIAPYLDGAALCICALGMTTYESLAAGVPCLVTNWSADHERTAIELATRGVVSNLGLWQSFDRDGFRYLVSQALEMSPLLDSTSHRAKALVDGKGAGRVADRIVEEVK